jgi:hypothetical protein
MNKNTANLALLLFAFVVIVAILAHHYDNFELSLRSLGLNIKADCESKTVVNMQLVAQELGLQS